MKKIKVLRIINRFNIGGPTYNATFLTRYLGDEYETKLIGGLPEPGEADSLFILEKYGVKPELIEELKREPNPASDRKAYRRIKKIIEEFQPDIVHTHASKAGAIGRKAAAACNVPVIVHTFHGHVFHSYFGKIKTRIFKEIEKNLARKSDGIIAISEQQKKELVIDHRICEADKIKVIPLGFDLTPFQLKQAENRGATREEFGISEDEVAIGIIGRLVPIKDHNFFLDTIDQVLEKSTKKLKIFIVGDGTERELIASRVEELNKKHGGKIVMTSWIRDIASFNAGMDIICLTSKNEGTPVSLIEAQAANIPVISTNVGGVKDIIRNQETGIIVDERDCDLYANELLELVENEKKRQKMSQNGWKHVEERFHYTTLVQNVDEFYKELLKKKGIL